MTSPISGCSSTTATARAMFYNPMRLPGMTEPSSCGGYDHHDLLRTADARRSRGLREENLSCVNAPTG